MSLSFWIEEKQCLTDLLGRFTLLLSNRYEISLRIRLQSDKQDYIKKKSPISRIDEVLERLEKATVYPYLDIKPRLHKIGVQSEDIQNMTFKSKYMHYEIVVVPMGLFPVLREGHTWQHNWQRTRYLPELFAYSYSLLWEGSWTFGDSTGLTATQPDSRWKLKSKISTKNTEFMVLQMGVDGIPAGHKRNKTLTDLPKPRSVLKLRRFTGLLWFFTTFIERGSQYVAISWILPGRTAALYVQIGAKIEWDSTETWTTVLDIIDAFLIRAFHALVCNLLNALLYFPKHQLIDNAPSPLSSIIPNTWITRLRTSHIRHYVRASASITISDTSIGRNRGKAKNRLLNKVTKGSLETGEVRSPPQTSTSITWMSYYSCCRNLRKCGMYILAAVRRHFIESSRRSIIYCTSSSQRPVPERPYNKTVCYKGYAKDAPRRSP